MVRPTDKRLKQIHQRAEPWSQFWQSGRGDACNLGESGQPPPSLTEDWKAFFASLPPEADVLDVGTGNGTLARLAAEILGTKEPKNKIVGIDAAKIAPAISEGAASPDFVELTFQGEMPIESLDFEDGSFDCVVGQYAVEYSVLQDSVPEMVRVLSDGGTFRALVHSSDSDVVRKAAKDLAAIEELTDDLALVPKARKMIKSRARLQSKLKKSGGLGLAPPPAEVKMQEALDSLQSKITKGSPTEHHRYFYRTMSDLFQRQTNRMSEQYLHFLESLEEEVSGYRLRLEQMQKAAMNEEKAEHFLDLLEDQGLETEPLVKKQVEDRILGWVFQGKSDEA